MSAIQEIWHWAQSQQDYPEMSVEELYLEPDGRQQKTRELVGVRVTVDVPDRNSAEQLVADLAEHSQEAVEHLEFVDARITWPVDGGKVTIQRGTDSLDDDDYGQVWAQADAPLPEGTTHRNLGWSDLSHGWRAVGKYAPSQRSTTEELVTADPLAIGLNNTSDSDYRLVLRTPEIDPSEVSYISPSLSDQPITDYEPIRVLRQTGIDIVQYQQTTLTLGDESKIVEAMDLLQEYGERTVASDELAEWMEAWTVAAGRFTVQTRLDDPLKEALPQLTAMKGLRSFAYNYAGRLGDQQAPIVVADEPDCLAIASLLPSSFERIGIKCDTADGGFYTYSGPRTNAAKEMPKLSQALAQPGVDHLGYTHYADDDVRVLVIAADPNRRDGWSSAAGQLRELAVDLPDSNYISVNVVFNDQIPSFTTDDQIRQAFPLANDLDFSIRSPDDTVDGRDTPRPGKPTPSLTSEAQAFVDAWNAR